MPKNGETVGDLNGEVRLSLYLTAIARLLVTHAGADGLDEALVVAVAFSGYVGVSGWAPFCSSSSQP